MSERTELLSSIANTIKDYRAGEMVQPSPEHVEKWVAQFSKASELLILQALDSVFKQTYIPKSGASKFFSNVIKAEALAGKNPCTFWKSGHFLNIQQNGSSQKEIREIFDGALKKNCGFGIEDCGSKEGPFFYLDDVMFSGNRVASDLIDWINSKAPSKSVVHILVIATHEPGEWYTKNRITKAAKAAGKTLELHCWAMRRFEGRKDRRDTSEVLWPATIPNDPALKKYLDAQRYPLELRKAGKGANEIFSSEAYRQVLETEFLLAGLKIRGFSKNPKDILKPLGFGLFGVGFGSVIATYRNCPNNCPLALWWGDPNASPSHPFSKWYPLLPRKTYGSGSDF